MKELEFDRPRIIRYIRTGYTNKHIAEHYGVSERTVKSFRKTLRDDGVDLTVVRDKKREPIPQLPTTPKTDLDAVRKRRQEYIQDLNNTSGENIPMGEMTLYKAIVYELGVGVSPTKIMERYKVDADTIELGYRIVANEKAKLEIRKLLANS